MSRDGERLIELVGELGARLSHLLTDMVPPAAQVHLLNAQRELITKTAFARRAVLRDLEAGGQLEARAAQVGA